MDLEMFFIKNPPGSLIKLYFFIGIGSGLWFLFWIGSRLTDGRIRADAYAVFNGFIYLVLAGLVYGFFTGGVAEKFGYFAVAVFIYAGLSRRVRESDRWI